MPAKAGIQGDHRGTLPWTPLAGDDDEGRRARLLCVRLTVWCKPCHRQPEPDPTEIASLRYRNRHSRLARVARLFPVQKSQRRHGGDRDRAAIALTAPPYLNLPADRSRPEGSLVCADGNRRRCPRADLAGGFTGDQIGELRAYQHAGTLVSILRSPSARVGSL